jgi:hypothetical protein
MTGDHGDARILRGRQLALRADLDAARSGGRDLVARRQLVQVVNGGAMPTSPDHFFLGNVVDAGGAEKEGGPPITAANTSTTIPFVVIRGVPSVGDQLVITAVGGRWVGERKGGTGTSICVTSCSPAVPLYGAVIQLWTTGTPSTLVTSCTTTTSSACCRFTQTGSYVVKVLVNGSVVNTSTRTLNGGTIVIALGASQANVVCCGGYAIPYNLTLTDAIGSLSFVYYPNYFYPIWYGGHPATGLSCSVTTPNNVCVAAAPSQGPVKVCYQMICNSGSTPAFTLQRSWSWVYQQGTLVPIWYQDTSGFVPGQPCTTAPPASCGSPHTDTASDSQAPSSTSPFVIDFNPAAAAGNYTGDPVGGGVVVSA